MNVPRPRSFETTADAQVRTSRNVEDDEIDFQELDSQMEDEELNNDIAYFRSRYPSAFLLRHRRPAINNWGDAAVRMRNVDYHHTPDLLSRTLLDHGRPHRVASPPEYNPRPGGPVARRERDREEIVEHARGAARPQRSLRQQRSRQRRANGRADILADELRECEARLPARIEALDTSLERWRQADSASHARFQEHSLWASAATTAKTRRVDMMQWFVRDVPSDVEVTLEGLAQAYFGVARCRFDLEHEEIRAGSRPDCDGDHDDDDEYYALNPGIVGPLGQTSEEYPNGFQDYVPKHNGWKLLLHLIGNLKVRVIRMVHASKHVWQILDPRMQKFMDKLTKTLYTKKIWLQDARPENIEGLTRLAVLASTYVQKYVGQVAPLLMKKHGVFVAQHSHARDTFNKMRASLRVAADVAGSKQDLQDRLDDIIKLLKERDFKDPQAELMTLQAVRQPATKEDASEIIQHQEATQKESDMAQTTEALTEVETEMMEATMTALFNDMQDE